MLQQIWSKPIFCTGKPGEYEHDVVPGTPEEVTAIAQLDAIMYPNRVFTVGFSAPKHGFIIVNPATVRKEDYDLTDYGTFLDSEKIWGAQQ